jgi:outer membrane protein assembly factor BamB
MTLLLATLAILLSRIAEAAPSERCLAGASRLHDDRDLTALRVAIDAACPCERFTGAPAADRSAYRRCARAVRDAAIVAGRLRTRCSKSATRGYAGTTCGTGGLIACGRLRPSSAKQAITCRIKSPGRCRSSGSYTETVCDGETHCADVVDRVAGTCLPVHESPYAPGWSAVHADASNTDYAPVDGARDLTLAWQRSFPGNVNLGAAIDPAGRVYVTESSTAPGCHLHALDGATGETLWCSAEVDRFAAASGVLLDRDGRIFLADGDAMHAFDPDGNLLWETPIVGVPLSAQLTPNGRVIFITHIGRIYVVRRETGEPVLPPVELIPGATWEPADGMTACLLGTAGCPSANTLAVDLATGRFFFTFWTPGAAQAGVRAMRFAEDPVPSLTPLWSNDALPGGSASSPDLAANGSRVYVTDDVDSVHALDAATGTELWRFRIGFAPGGSPSLSPAGLLMPSGSSTGVVLALADRGAFAELIWRRDGFVNRGVPTQAAGGLAYATVDAGAFANDLVVVDTATGAELDRERLPGTTVFTVGTTVGPDGTVYVPTFLGQLFAFRPA